MDTTSRADQRPWPEAAGGAIMGALLAMTIAFVPGLSVLIERPETAPWVLVAGAVIGAALSYRVAGRSMRRILAAERTVETSQKEAERRAA